MRIHKNIFKITKENLLFLQYLDHHPGFTINEVTEEFKLKYNTLHNHLQEWEAQGYIIKEKLPPELGATKFKYSLSVKARKELKELWKIEL
jgi:DNA-binding MarR family transcriptional regulator